MEPLDLYILMKMDTIIAAMEIVAIISLIPTIATILFTIIKLLDTYDFKNEIVRMWLRGAKASISVLLFAGALNILLPTTKELATIWLVPDILNNESIDYNLSSRDKITLQNLINEWTTER